MKHEIYFAFGTLEHFDFSENSFMYIYFLLEVMANVRMLMEEMYDILHFVVVILYRLK